MTPWNPPSRTLGAVPDTGPRTRPLPRRVPGAGGIDELVITVVLITMPLGYIGASFGVLQLSGWAWPLSLAVALLAVSIRPLPHRAVRLLLPYLLFLAIALVSLFYAPVFYEGLLTLGQLAAPALVYVVAFRTPLDERLRRRVVALCAFALASALLVFGVARLMGTFERVATRTMSINMVIVFLLLSALARSRLMVILGGLAGLVIAVGTGSRMAAAVLALVVLFAPRVFETWRWRAAALAVGLALIPVIISLPAIQDRFFYGESEGTVGDVISLAPNVNTSGRLDVWPGLVAACAERPWSGYGIGASYELTRDVSDGALNHPHNDYLRTFCDTGLPGSVLAWFFVGAAGVRSLVRVRRGGHSKVVTAALLGVVAFLLVALTDNVLVYPAQFTLPFFLTLGWADGSASPAVRSGPRPRRQGPRRAPAEGAAGEDL